MGLPVSEKYKSTLESYFFTDLQNNSIFKKLNPGKLFQYFDYFS